MEPSPDVPIALWRNPGRSTSGRPIVVFLHGRGADEYDLMSLADALPQALTYVSLRGLLDFDGSGYTWFESRGAAQPLAKSLRASIATVRHWLDRFAAANETGPLFLLGFSAGMMMAGALILDDPARYAGAILLSGALPLDSGLAAGAERLQGLPVFYGRGTFDDVIPASLVRQTQTYLSTTSGAELTARDYEHAHSISKREIDDIARWLSERA